MYGLWFVPPEKMVDSLKVQFSTAEVPCVLKHKSLYNGLLAVSVKGRCTNTFIKTHVHVTGLLVCQCGMYDVQRSFLILDHHLTSVAANGSAHLVGTSF
jgi:hypothetical protein